MEQDEEVICIIKKDSNHVSNQYLANQKERTKNLLQPNDKMESDSSQKRRKKWEKSELNQINSNYFNSKNYTKFCLGLIPGIKILFINPIQL